MFFWILSARLWLNHGLYQHLMCHAKGRPKAFCEKKLIIKTEKLTSLGKIQNLKALQEGDKVWRGSLTWRMAGFHIPVKASLRLP